MKINNSEKRTINVELIVPEDDCWECDYVFNSGLCEIFQKQVNKVKNHKSRPLAVCRNSTTK